MRMKRAVIRLFTLGLAALLLCGCDLAASLTERGPASPTDQPFTLSGTMEAKEVSLAPELGGPIVAVAVKEGETVAAGSMLARLDSSLLLDQRAQAEAAVDQARAAVDAAQAQLALGLAGAREEEVASARSAVAAARANVALASSQKEAAQGRRAAAQSEVAAAEGQWAAAQAVLKGAQALADGAQAALSQGRAGATAQEIAIAEHHVEAAKNALWGRQAQRDGVCGQVGIMATQADCDLAQAMAQVAEEQVRIAELELQRARDGLRPEEIAALESQVAAAQADVERAHALVDAAEAALAAAQAAVAMAAADDRSAQARVDVALAQRDQAQAVLDLLLAGARAEQIDVLRAGVAQAQAALDSAQAAVAALDTQIAKLTLVAPIDGEVLHGLAHVGEVARPGVPLFVLADLSRLTLTVYVPVPDLGRVYLGQAVDVTVDAYPDTFAGQVTHIASRAEFTPKNVDTREERVNMVFPVKISLDNPDGRLKPGMPADATLR